MPCLNQAIAYSSIQRGNSSRKPFADLRIASARGIDNANRWPRIEARLGPLGESMSNDGLAGRIADFANWLDVRTESKENERRATSDYRNRDLLETEIAELHEIRYELKHRLGI
jgi:hypothetical protein